jgi:hypothetical protein
MAVGGRPCPSAASGVLWGWPGGGSGAEEASSRARHVTTAAGEQPAMEQAYSCRLSASASDSSDWPFRTPIWSVIRQRSSAGRRNVQPCTCLAVDQFSLSKVHQRSLNLRCCVIPVPKLANRPFRSSNLFICVI